MELSNQYTIPMVVTYEMGDKKERAMSERLTRLEDETIRFRLFAIYEYIFGGTITWMENLPAIK